MRETEKGRERERERERERDEERWTERKRHSNTLNVCVHERDSSREKFVQRMCACAIHMNTPTDRLQK